MNTRGLMVLAAAAAGALGFGVSAQAAPVIGIGVQFIGDSNIASPAMTSTDTAGVVAQPDWNALSGAQTGGTLTSFGLHDNLGDISGATISGGGYGSYRGGGAGFPAGTGDNKLSSGELYSGSLVNGSFTFAAIPYATYDVYVYGASDAAGRDTTYAVTPLGAAGAQYRSLKSVYTTGWVQGTNSTWDGTGTAPALDPANYVLFSGLTASSFMLQFGAAGNGAMNGVQIVESVPEPVTLSLIGLGAVLLLSGRRRKA